jgi:hypothetical protein
MSQHSAEERIEMRDHQAKYHIDAKSGDNGFLRAKAKLGLKTANAIDKVGSAVDNERFIFSSQMISGAVRGAFYGAVATFIAVACFPAIPVAAIIPLYAACMLGGAASYAVIDSTVELNRHVSNVENKISDQVAQAMGAVPEPIKEVKFDKSFVKDEDRKAAVAQAEQLLKSRGVEVNEKRKNGSPYYTSRPDYTSRINKEKETLAAASHSR